MDITFAALSTEHQSAVMEIFNYYVQSGTAAFPAHALPEPFFAMLLKKADCTYFLSPEYAGRGIGRQYLDKLIGEDRDSRKTSDSAY